jgi:CRP-like cAMP-binding protein
MSKTTMRRIHGLELFDGCTRSQLAAIDRLGTTVDVPAGTRLCAEGMTGNEFFLLVDGLVDVRTSGGVAALLRPGAWFGEAALLDGAPRRATLVTRTESMLIVLDRREFNTLLQIAPSVRRRLRECATRVASGTAPTRQPWYQHVSYRLALTRSRRALSRK